MTKTITVTPTLLNADAYDSGDLLFEQCEVVGVGEEDTLDSVTVIDEADQGVAFDLYLSDRSVDWGTLDSAPSIADADARGIFGHVAIASGDWKDLGGARVATIENIGLVCRTGKNGKIYLAGVTGGTPTYATGALKITLGLVDEQ